MSGQSTSNESMFLNVIDKVNSHPKFLHRQNRPLTPPLLRLFTIKLAKRS